MTTGFDNGFFWIDDLEDIGHLVFLWAVGEPIWRDSVKKAVCVRREDGLLKNCDPDKKYEFVCELRC